MSASTWLVELRVEPDRKMLVELRIEPDRKISLDKLRERLAKACAYSTAADALSTAVGATVQMRLTADAPYDEHGVVPLVGKAAKPRAKKGKK